MTLASSQGNQPVLARLPAKLPGSQAEWMQFIQALQSWQRALQTLTWQTPALQNGWEPYGAPYEPPGYYMDAAGRVHLRGLVKSGTVGLSTPVFTLPVGYVPPYDVIVPVVTNANVFGSVRVAAGTAGGGAGPGAVAVDVGSNTWISLAGISFSTQ